ncbi:MAG TPA: NAD(+)/NADH kinase [Candidatus Eisenbacteria bacterium]|nr:NAD(+)/NADH kinase [Candidatus Eisenbacteria bacterium]
MSRAGRRVGILGHTGRPPVQKAARRLTEALVAQGHRVAIDELLAKEMKLPGVALEKIAADCHLLISLGGDGTALKGARALVGRKGALLPVNFGGLGFLTVAEELDVEDAVRLALVGRWKTVERRPVEAVVTRRGKRLKSGLGMNDAVLKTSGGYSALHMRLHALGSDLGHLVADGLIAATAAGSTAYSLSAGGPVVSRGLESLVVTPVCAHTLGSRSLVLAGDDALKVKVIGTSDHAMLLIDGQESIPLQAGDQVTMTLADQVVRIFENPEQPLARALQAKLGWQGSERRSLV